MSTIPSLEDASVASTSNDSQFLEPELQVAPSSLQCRQSCVLRGSCAALAACAEPGTGSPKLELRLRLSHQSWAAHPNVLDDRQCGPRIFDCS
eukprot:9397376-Pyramimonas_sp.AAC.1